MNQSQFIRTIIERSQRNYSLEEPFSVSLLDLDRCHQGNVEDEIKRMADKSIELAKKECRHFSVKDVLTVLFRHAVRSIPPDDHAGRWRAVMLFLASTMQHPRLYDPLNPDGSNIANPLVLFWLGEGRCGYIASMVVDIALANGYAARLVQLAAHVVAEVKWNGAWHCIDAFGLRSKAAILKPGELPSVEELALSPYQLDTVALRSTYISPKMKKILELNPPRIPYPGAIPLSSSYFAKELFENKFEGNPRLPRKGIQYYYKTTAGLTGNYPWWVTWATLKYHGHPTPMVPLEFLPSTPEIICPSMLHVSPGEKTVTFTVSVKPSKIPLLTDQEDIENKEYSWIICKDYEAYISSSSRGWSFDYPDYNYMPAHGKGDILVTDNFIYDEDSGIFSVKLIVPADLSCCFVDVIPKSPLRHSSVIPAAWPSSECCVEICKV